MPTSRAIFTELDNLLAYLNDARLALYVTPIDLKPTYVTWSATMPFTTSGSTITFSEYVTWLECQQYSALLFDGSLLQVTYELAGNIVIGHRLAYVPCPYELSTSDLDVLPAGDVVRLASLEDPILSLTLRSAIRFDYDPTAARPGHPAVHMTMNSHDCRIPCHSPLRLGHFIAFIFANFYSSIWASDRFLPKMTRGSWGDRALTEREESETHLTWRQPLHLGH